MRTVFLMLILCQPAWGEIYKYVDENGKIHFTDSPPLDQATEKLAIEQPVKHDTPPLDEAMAKSLFEQDNLRRKKIREKRKLEAEKHAKEKAVRVAACDKAKSELARMKQYRAQASSINSKRYYNKRVDMAKDQVDDACKLSNFR